MHSLGSQLATGQRLVGEISGDGNVQVDGRFEGAIHIGGRLTVGENALVLADVVADSLHIEGRVEGQVRVVTEVTIGQHGCLVGDVTGSLHVEEGGVFQGRITSERPRPNTYSSASEPSVAESGRPTPPEHATSDLPPVHFFDSVAPTAQETSTAQKAIRRLTEDDTLPPAPAPQPGRSVAGSAATPPTEVPITRKQRIRTDTKPKHVPPPIVRASSKPARGELDDPWFETEDEPRDSK